MHLNNWEKCAWVIPLAKLGAKAGGGAPAGRWEVSSRCTRDQCSPRWAVCGCGLPRATACQRGAGSKTRVDVVVRVVAWLPVTPWVLCCTPVTYFKSLNAEISLKIAYAFLPFSITFKINWSERREIICTLRKVDMTEDEKSVILRFW